MKRTVRDLGSSRPHNGERTRELRADAAVFAAIFVAAIEVGAATLAVVSVVAMLVDIRSTSCDDQNQGFGAFRAFGCSELPCGFQSKRIRLGILGWRVKLFPSQKLASIMIHIQGL